MEVIKGAEALEYLRGPYAGKEGIAGAITKKYCITSKEWHKAQGARHKGQVISKQRFNKNSG